MLDIRKFLTAIGLLPVSSTGISAAGELEFVAGSTNKFQGHNGTSASPIVTEAHAATLTNKTISGSSNTLTNIPNSALAATTGTSILKGNGSGGFSNASSGTDYAVPTTGTSSQLLGSNGSGGFSNVTVGSGLTYSAGTITATAGSGTVTSVSITSANGFAGSVATATTTPAITISTSITGLLKGNGTAISAASSGTDYAPATSGSSILYGNSAGGFSNASIGNSLSFSAGTLSYSGTRGVNAQSGTSYTFVLTDGSNNGDNKLVTGTNGSTQTYTIPPHSSVAFPVGTQIDIMQLGTGKITFSPGSGVTLNANGSVYSTGGQYVPVSMIQVATDSWVLFGNLVA